MEQAELQRQPDLSARQGDRTHAEQDVVGMLATMTYDDIHRQTGWSRGRIYNIAVKYGARKNEDRIAQRRADREAMQVEFLKEVMGTTARADVLDYLAGLPDGCADLVLTSPPYKLGKTYTNKPGCNSSLDTMRFCYYTGWLTMCVAEMERVLKPGGTICLQLGQTKDDGGALYPLDVVLFETLKRLGLTYQSRVIWTFSHGLTPKRRLSERYETMLVFSKGDQQVFNSNAGRFPAKEPHKRAFKGPHNGRLSGHYLGVAPSNVWHLPQVGHNHPEKTAHPCQFPLGLAKRAVMLYTNTGATVVDPFSGSGTTHAACIESGRAFTGCDLFYEDERRARLAKVMPDLVTMFPGVTDESSAVWRAEAREVRAAAKRVSKAQEWDLFSQAMAGGLAT